MEKVILNTPGSRSEIMIGQGWETAFRLLPENDSVIITDDNVRRIYGDRFPNIPVLSVEPGEESKRLGVIEKLSEQLLEAGLDRNGFILAIGGGVVCDLAGFLASVYLRGVRCGYISTSLLAQVDASTGGKNGVNSGGTKNILGVIRQPEFVFCDPGMLLTLPEDEYLSGLAEMIKTGIIGDPELFDRIEQNQELIMERDQELLTELVSGSVRFKASVVSEDEHEAGLRRILNFGHTFGHAIEMQTMVKHGFAVAAGMELAAGFSFERGLIGSEVKERIVDLMKNFGLHFNYELPSAQVEKLVMHDKKKSGSGINFVFITAIGQAVVEKIPVSEILDFYKRHTDAN